MEKLPLQYIMLDTKILDITVERLSRNWRTNFTLKRNVKIISVSHKKKICELCAEARFDRIDCAKYNLKIRSKKICVELSKLYAHFLSKHLETFLTKFLLDEKRRAKNNRQWNYALGNVPEARIHPRNSCASVGDHLSIRRIWCLTLRHFSKSLPRAKL